VYYKAMIMGLEDIMRALIISKCLVIHIDPSTFTIYKNIPSIINTR